MTEIINSLYNNFGEISQVVFLSLFISTFSTGIASILACILGIPVALNNFKMKKAIMRVTNTLMSLPPVLMGLLVYMTLSRRGPLGKLEILFTPTAMIISQSLLVFPIVFGLIVSSVSKSAEEIKKTCTSLGAGKYDTFTTVIKESKGHIFTAITTGFGRAISEVGAVMMVGGNIRGYTRVMTTYIALETNKGNYNEAVFIGLLLLFISFLVNSILHRFQGREY
ncbi:ABC transporter permease [uncultured Clostridium sp.]|uniref:ABC transporter permease n=1 Tax=uncultured Clostridium sp. TaxID=59620 RepID=UPI0028F01240|nr:ABC transporter permease [uncultured Clostridium sp.]